MRNYYFLLWVLLFVEGESGDGNEEVEVSVTKGDSITLPGFPGVQKTDQIIWKFGDVIIFKFEEAENVSKKPEDGIFKDRLDLNNTTGALTITQVTSEHAGRYYLDIRSKNKPPPPKIFNVTVHDIKSVSKRKGDSFSLNTDAKEQGVGVIQWKFGDQDLKDRNGRWSNVHPNDQTGELQFRDIQINQFGLYEVSINTSRLILHRKFSVASTYDHMIYWMIIEGLVILFVIVIVIVILIVCCRKIYTCRRRMRQ